MRQISFAPSFEAWKEAARRALWEGLHPTEVVWWETGDPQPALGLFNEVATEPTAAPSEELFRVPAAFPPLARRVSCHRDPQRWHLLYATLWRLTHGEPKLLEIASDPDTHELQRLDRAIRDDVHKMRAFVRFRETLPDPAGQPWYVAWFEPQHDILELNARFFTDRFANMRWSILTPDRCMHWDGSQLNYTACVSKNEAPTEDSVEALWVKYYGQIFNPARIKTRAMQHSMPKRYWKNLPEAATISALLQEAPARVDRMIAASEMKRTDHLEWQPAEPPQTRSLPELAAAAARCKACPLYKTATQTVFGEGPADATIVLVGEQPGDKEDLAGHPFVGPAGQLLDRALAEAGVERSLCYVTNTVKHFKWEPRGKRRLHATPNSRDIAACRPWLEAELASLCPTTLVCLGSTAAKAICGPEARVLRDRGKFMETTFCRRTLLTVHPSSLLRAPSEEERRVNYGRFVEDLRLILEKELP